MNEDNKGITNNKNKKEKNKIKDDIKDFRENKNLKKNVMTSIVWFSFNGHFYTLMFYNEISNVKIGKDILNKHLNNLKEFFSEEYEVSFKEDEDDYKIVEDIYKIDDITTICIIINKINL